jgi:hypothetical protein
MLARAPLARALLERRGTVVGVGVSVLGTGAR